MSWFSNLEHAVLGAITGKTASPIVDNPTTPLEQAVNQLGAATASTLSSTTTVVKQAATSTVQGYLVNSIGNVGAEIADTALEGLAATAISKMSASSNKTEEEVAALLGSFLKSFTAAPTAA